VSDRNGGGCKFLRKADGSDNPNDGGTLPRNRAHGAVGQNTIRSIKRVEKREKFQPKEMCFFWTSPFIELMWASLPLPSRITGGGGLPDSSLSVRFPRTVTLGAQILSRTALFLTFELYSLRFSAV
jgi:hypothetical protein